MHNLLKDYLTDRKQFTTYKNAKSDDTKIVCDIPQGPALGSLRFSNYLNDLPFVTNSHIKLFADDTAIILEGCKELDTKSVLWTYFSLLPDPAPVPLLSQGKLLGLHSTGRIKKINPKESNKCIEQIKRYQLSKHYSEFNREYFRQQTNL